MAEHMDYSATSSDTAATDSDSSDSSASPAIRTASKPAARSNGNAALKRRAIKTQLDTSSTKRRRATRNATAPATKRAGRAPKAAKQRQASRAVAGNGSKKQPSGRRRRGDADDEEDEHGDDVEDGHEGAAQDEGMEDESMAEAQRQRVRRYDGEDEEGIEADSEDVLASLLSHGSSLSSPSMLARPRYLAIVVEDLQQLLLPATLTSSASPFSAYGLPTASHAQRPPGSWHPHSLLSPTTSASAFRAFAFLPSEPSEPPDPSPVHSVLQHALLSRPFRLHCQAQLFTASIDTPYMHYDEFADCYSERVASQPQLRSTQPAPLPVNSLSLNFFDSPSPSHLPLSHPVCRVLRRSLGRPRRFSRAFIAEERVKLAEYRNYVRVNQRGAQSLHPPPFVPAALQSQPPRPRLVQGQEVVCVHPQTGELHDGVVVGYGQDRADRISSGLFHYYRVKFKQIELGSALVEDVSVMTDPRLPARPMDEDVLPSIDTLVGAGTRIFARFAESSLPFSPLSSPYSPHPLSSSSQLPIECHLIASVLKLLDRKSLLIQQLELMNHTYTQLTHMLDAPHMADTPPLPPLPFVDSQLSSFVHSYAWAVIQLERTSQSLEGALMHYRLQLTRTASSSRPSPLTRRGRAVKREKGSDMLHALQSPGHTPPTVTPSFAASTTSDQALLFPLLTSASAILASARSSLEGEGLLLTGWWQRVRGSGVEDVLLLSVAAVLALQRGDERAVRAVVELWRRKADGWRLSGTAGLPLQVQFEHVLQSLELLLADSASVHFSGGSNGVSSGSVG